MNGDSNQTPKRWGDAGLRNPPNIRDQDGNPETNRADQQILRTPVNPRRDRFVPGLPEVMTPVQPPRRIEVPGAPKKSNIEEGRVRARQGQYVGLALRNPRRRRLFQAPQRTPFAEININQVRRGLHVGHQRANRNTPRRQVNRRQIARPIIHNENFGYQRYNIERRRGSNGEQNP